MLNESLIVQVPYLGVHGPYKTKTWIRLKLNDEVQTHYLPFFDFSLNHKH